MLTDFQKYFTVAESVVNLQEIRIYIFPHTLNMSLHYIAKYLCSKNGRAPEETEAHCSLPCKT